MSLASFANDTVTIVRAALVDDHGTMIADWSDATETEVTGCSMQPATGDENLEHRDATERLWTLYAPPGTDLRSTDRVRFAGMTFDVVGAPMPWNVPGSAINHVQATLRYWEG